MLEGVLPPGLLSGSCFEQKQRKAGIYKKEWKSAGWTVMVSDECVVVVGHKVFVLSR